MPTINFTAHSERGVRTQNDDAYCAERLGKYFVFAIAEGLTGHRYGNLASTTAIEALRDSVKSSGIPAKNTLLDAIRKAESEIKMLSKKSPGHAGLATKLVACLIDEKMKCTVLDVSDRNCLVIGKSMVASAGKMKKSLRSSKDAPAPLPPSLSDMISHVLGEPHRLKSSDFAEFVLGSQFILLGSGGLTDSLNDRKIADIVRNAEGDLDIACEKLVQESLLAGSERTITAVLVKGSG